MPYLRLLLAWFVMIAVPAQGFAAASMLFCGGATAHHVQTASHTHPAGTSAHDHSRHQPEPKAVVDQDSAKLGGDAQAGDLMHKCGVCASCCHAAAITQAPHVVLPDRPARAHLGEPMLAAYSRPSVVPDKPPRA